MARRERKRSIVIFIYPNVSQCILAPPSSPTDIYVPPPSIHRHQILMPRECAGVPAGSHAATLRLQCEIATGLLGHISSGEGNRGEWPRSTKEYGDANGFHLENGDSR
ncbi:hypothetical protein KM043_016865 [Ampulex compressa]|nr:hypothetical protein KM043_016865 [Ampulex compressa]